MENCTNESTLAQSQSKFGDCGPVPPRLLVAKQQTEEELHWLALGSRQDLNGIGLQIPVRLS